MDHLCQIYSERANWLKACFDDLAYPTQVEWRPSMGTHIERSFLPFFAYDATCARLLKLRTTPISGRIFKIWMHDNPMLARLPSVCGKEAPVGLAIRKNGAPR